MVNPRVGAILVMSSPLNFLTTVVFPALSKPLFCFCFLFVWGSVRFCLGVE